MMAPVFNDTKQDRSKQNVPIIKVVAMRKQNNSAASTYQ